MDTTWQQSREAFADAAGWFAQTTTSARGCWDLPGLADWDIRALVGHTSRALLTVKSYLARPATSAEIATAGDYYRATRAIAAGPEVTERGREAGTALGDDPAGAVSEIATGVVELLAGRDGTELITTVAGGMYLADYLPTRTFELVVHTADLASALGLSLTIPSAAARQALYLVADLAAGETTAGPLLLAATGRTGLPPGFSVL